MRFKTMSLLPTRDHEAEKKFLESIQLDPQPDTIHIHLTQALESKRVQLAAKLFLLLPTEEQEAPEYIKAKRKEKRREKQRSLLIQNLRSKLLDKKETVIEDMKEKKYKIVCRPLKYQEFISLKDTRVKDKRPKTAIKQVPGQPTGGILGMIQANL